jgi:antitoxin Phd
MSVAQDEMHEWKLQDAGAKLSDVVRLAHREGPQAIVQDGKREAVLLSAEAYDALRPRPKQSLAEFLLAGPPWSDDLVEAILDRSPDTGRDIEF